MTKNRIELKYVLPPFCCILEHFMFINLYFCFFIFIWIADLRDRDNPIQIEYDPCKIYSTSIWIRCPDMDHKRLSTDWCVRIRRSGTTAYHGHCEIFNWTISTAFLQRKFMFYSIFVSAFVLYAVHTLDRVVHHNRISFLDAFHFGAMCGFVESLRFSLVLHDFLWHQHMKRCSFPPHIYKV